MSLFVKPRQYNFVQLPMGDKSITHRAIMLSAFGDRPITINNANICLDTLATVDCMRTLGADITVNGYDITVKPITKLNNNVILDCRNSGTTARLLCGLLCGCGITANFVGDSSLTKRPMRMIEPLRNMGANIEITDKGFTIHPSTQLYGIDYNMDFCSAQVKSAVLLAGIFADGKTIVTEKPTRKHTEYMLSAFGANIFDTMGKTIVGRSTLHTHNLTIPNDISTVAFLLPLGLFDRNINISNVLYSPNRMGILELLWQSKANIAISNILGQGEKSCDLFIEKSVLAPLKCPECLVSDMIDEVIIASIVACMVQGTSYFAGLSELAYKESNRLLGIVDMVNSIGCHATISDDNLTIKSKGIIRGGAVRTYGDHRIAMAGVIAGLLSTEGVTLDDIACIDVSCPNFLQMLGITR